jgi:putative exporter of polyketide antibiotics
MNLRDLLHPERAVAFAFKLCCAILCLLALPSFLATLLSQLSGTQLLSLMLLGLVVSPIAYVIRECQHRHPARAPRRGAERTPLPPPNEEEE